MGLTAETFAVRISRGNKAEDAFVEHMKSKYGLDVARVSQHESRPSNKLLRHFPDMFIVAFGVLVQVKDGLQSGRWKHVIAEVESIKACQELYGQGRRVWVVWEYPGGSWHGNYIQNLYFDGHISLASRDKGSGTPAYKIRKTSLQPLDELVNKREQPRLF